MDVTESIRRAHTRDRVQNIFSAAIVDAPSYSDAELWTLIEGTAVGDKPTSEQQSVVRARNEYDRALGALRNGNPATVGETAIELGPARNAVLHAVNLACHTAEAGGAAHTVINILNLSLIAAGESPVRVYRKQVPAVAQGIEIARRGRTEPFSRLVMELSR